VDLRARRNVGMNCLSDLVQLLVAGEGVQPLESLAPVYGSAGEVKPPSC